MTRDSICSPSSIDYGQQSLPWRIHRTRPITLLTRSRICYEKKSRKCCRVVTPQDYDPQPLSYSQRHHYRWYWQLLWPNSHYTSRAMSTQFVTTELTWDNAPPTYVLCATLATLVSDVLPIHTAQVKQTLRATNACMICVVATIIMDCCIANTLHLQIHARSLPTTFLDSNSSHGEGCLLWNADGHQLLWNACWNSFLFPLKSGLRNSGIRNSGQTVCPHDSNNNTRLSNSWARTLLTTRLLYLDLSVDMMYVMKMYIVNMHVVNMYVVNMYDDDYIGSCCS